MSTVWKGLIECHETAKVHSGSCSLSDNSLLTLVFMEAVDSHAVLFEISIICEKCINLH